MADGFVKQLTVFIENRVGTLEEVAKVLKENDINIYSISLADTLASLSASLIASTKAAFEFLIVSNDTSW